MSRMTCNEFEILLADYLDGTLATEERAAVEEHRNACASCTEPVTEALVVCAFAAAGKAASISPVSALAHSARSLRSRDMEPPWASKKGDAK